MRKSITKISILFFLVFFHTAQAKAFQAWWECQSRQGGEWNFGRAPSACLVDHMQTQNFVKKQYDSIIFDDSKNKAAERVRYLT
ncbi:MAG: hypothetical protein AAF203_03495, partial [Pseudomonadota bacterium]